MLLNAEAAALELTNCPAYRTHTLLKAKRTSRPRKQTISVKDFFRSNSVATLGASVTLGLRVVLSFRDNLRIAFMDVFENAIWFKLETYDGIWCTHDTIYRTLCLLSECCLLSKIRGGKEELPSTLPAFPQHIRIDLETVHPLLSERLLPESEWLCVCAYEHHTMEVGGNRPHAGHNLSSSSLGIECTGDEQQEGRFDRQHTLLDVDGFKMPQQQAYPMQQCYSQANGNSNASQQIRTQGHSQVLTHQQMPTANNVPSSNLQFTQAQPGEEVYSNREVDAPSIFNPPK